MPTPAPIPPPKNGTEDLSRFFYSFDYGPVHFVSYSSEHTFTKGSQQHAFLQRDLAAAAAPAARALRPWIVVFGHRPLYCSDYITWSSRCVLEGDRFKANV